MSVTKDELSDDVLIEMMNMHDTIDPNLPSDVQQRMLQEMLDRGSQKDVNAETTTALPDHVLCNLMDLYDQIDHSKNSAMQQRELQNALEVQQVNLEKSSSSQLRRVVLRNRYLHSKTTQGS